MKKVILFAAILFSAVSFVKAQSNEGTANLTINLNAVQSISVSGDVVIDYTTAADYENGKGSEQTTKLNVVSAGGFAIRVEAEDLTDGASTISAETVGVTAVASSENGKGAKFDTDGTLVKGAKKTALITSTEGGVNKKYNVSYKGKGGNEYMRNYNEGGKAFTTTVIYTIAAQ